MDSLYVILDIVIVVLGAYYIIAIGIFQFGLKGPIENRLQKRVGNLFARIIYALIGAIGIALVVTGII